MTAINVFLRRDRAMMMTDAAFYTPQGVIVGFGQKAVAMPNMKAVISCRGSQKVTALLAMELSVAYQTYDDLLDSAERDLRTYHDQNLMELSRLGLQDINVVVAGWSDEKNGPAGFYFDSTTDTFEEIDEYIVAPLLSDEEQTNVALSVKIPRGGNFFDPVIHGIPYMEAQRRMKLEISDVSEPISIVGGHILLTEVSRDGVSQRVIHRWNDEIGMPIEPAEFVPPPAVPLNRHQRRALARAGGR